MQLRDGGGGGVRVLINAEDLRRGSGVLKESSARLQALANTVGSHTIPELPPELAAVPIELTTVGRSVGSEADPFVDLSKELRVRAFWADVADAQSECRNLGDAEITEMLLLMRSGDLLAYGVTSVQAEYAGRMLGSQFRDTFQQPAKLIELANLLRPNAANADFAAGFIDSFGAENFVEIPRVLQAMEHPWSVGNSWYMDPGSIRQDIAQKILWDNPDYRYDGNILDLLAPFTQALAVATYAGTLSRDRQQEIARDGDQWAVATLLSHPGTYGKDFLLDVFKTGVVDRIINDYNGEYPGLWQEHVREDTRIPLGWTNGNGGLPSDPKVIILNALARNADAAAVGLTAKIPPVELVRIMDSRPVTVTDPMQLLLEFGTYGDEGVALGEASASGVAGLHTDGQHAEANQITERLIHEVIRGERGDIDGIRDGLARVIATPGIMDNLHSAAASSESSVDYDRDHDGLVGSSDADGIRLSTSQLRDLLGELSERDLSRTRLLDGVMVHQTNEILAATGPGGPQNVQWATEVGNFNGLLTSGVNEERIHDFEARKKAHEQIFGAINKVTGLVPVAKPIGIITDQTLSLIKDATAPSGQVVLDQNYDAAQEMRGRMNAAIVAGYFENGSFGGPADVGAQINRLDSPGYEVESFLDDNGHILPYDRMNDDQRATFEEWMNSDRVQNVVHNALESAGNGVDARATR
jgi:hypothetical protein